MSACWHSLVDLRVHDEFGHRLQLKDRLLICIPWTEGLKAYQCSRSENRHIDQRSRSSGATGPVRQETSSGSAVAGGTGANAKSLHRCEHVDTNGCVEHLPTIQKTCFFKHIVGQLI